MSQIEIFFPQAFNNFNASGFLRRFILFKIFGSCAIASKRTILWANSSQNIDEIAKISPPPLFPRYCKIGIIGWSEVVVVISNKASQFLPSNLIDLQNN